MASSASGPTDPRGESIEKPTVPTPQQGVQKPIGTSTPQSGLTDPRGEGVKTPTTTGSNS